MIRRIKTEDAAAVSNICRDQLGHQTSEELIRQRISELENDSHYYVAVYEDDEDHAVRGFIQAERYNLLYGDNGWNIIALAAAKGNQGKGIGRDLLAALEAYAARCGDTFIRLNSRVERLEAHGFYEHMGYQCDKTQKRFIKKF